MKLSKLMGVLLCFVAVSAWAADLASAKGDGIIGEREDGYLGYVVGDAPADVVALVNDVNAKRRAEYERIAAKNNLRRADVESLAGKKAISRTAAGGYVYSAGRWMKK